MSRVAKNPISLPKGVDLQIDASNVSVKGSKGSLNFTLPKGIVLEQDGQTITVAADCIVRDAAKSGTVRAFVANMVKGVSEGYERRLQLVGVGYRASTQGKIVNLAVGLSHPVNYPIPEGITVETPSQTEIVIRGADKQVVGQVAADLRSYRPPEPYKGKGVRYLGEKVVMKEAKKK